MKCLETDIEGHIYWINKRLHIISHSARSDERRNINITLTFVFYVFVFRLNFIKFSDMSLPLSFVLKYIVSTKKKHTFLFTFFEYQYIKVLLQKKKETRHMSISIIEGTFIYLKANSYQAQSKTFFLKAEQML